MILTVAVSDHLCMLRPKEQTLPTCLLNFDHVPVFKNVLYCQIKRTFVRQLVARNTFCLLRPLSHTLCFFSCINKTLITTQWL